MVSDCGRVTVTRAIPGAVYRNRRLTMSEKPGLTQASEARRVCPKFFAVTRQVVMCICKVPRLYAHNTVFPSLGSVNK